MPPPGPRARTSIRDYAANLLQSLADARLLQPGAPGCRAASARRECCCDDIVARAAAGAVSALTTLARLGVWAARPPSAPPDLASSFIRELLLQEDAMTPFAGYRLAARWILAARGGRRGGVVPLPPQRWPARGHGRARAAGGRYRSRHPDRFHDEPAGATSGCDMQRTEAGLCGIAEIENLANVSITGVRFAAFAYAPAPLPRSNLFKASFATSELLAAEVSPHQIATLDVGLLTSAEARERLDTPYATIMCAVAEIRYANGARWEMPPATVFGP
jgi:hypothetical protein